MVPCPQPTPIPDEFGRTSQKILVYNAVICYEYNSIKQEKLFGTKEEAELFIERGEEESDLKDFQLFVIKEK